MSFLIALRTQILCCEFVITFQLKITSSFHVSCVILGAVNAWAIAMFDRFESESILVISRFFDQPSLCNFPNKFQLLFFLFSKSISVILFSIVLRTVKKAKAQSIDKKHPINPQKNQCKKCSKIAKIIPKKKETKKMRFFIRICKKSNKPARSRETDIGRESE